ncbi:MAG: AbrB/MazE/SpoVT family DNA-binding domain-containing protein, partial [Oxalobacteraceae bacterium]
MIKLKVTDVGNALGVVLPKSALERLHVVKGDTLNLSSGADGLHLLSPDEDDMVAEIEMAEKCIQ